VERRQPLVSEPRLSPRLAAFPPVKIMSEREVIVHLGTEVIVDSILDTMDDVYSH
jgi:hypothetical protein